MREDIFSSICSSEHEKRRNIKKNKSPPKDYKTDRSRMDHDSDDSLNTPVYKEEPSMTSQQSQETQNRGPKPQLSKDVNALNDLLNSITPDKSICYTQFYQFYDTIKTLTEVKRYYKPDDTDNSTISQPNRTTDFLWFLINPDKMDSVRRKTV